MSDWYNPKLADDPRWKYGTPPVGNANFAWVQHFIYHLSPRGTAGFVLANGSLSSKTSGEGDIRRKLVEEDLVDCIVAMPDKLFFNTGIPVALWFVSKDRHGNGHRRRVGEVLFIDARRLGAMVTRRLRELSDDDIARIAGSYHAWRNHGGGYYDVPGFAKAAALEDVRHRTHHVLGGQLHQLLVGERGQVLGEQPTRRQALRLLEDVAGER